MVKPNVLKVMANSNKRNNEPANPPGESSIPVAIEPRREQTVLYVRWPVAQNNLQSKKMEMEMHMTYESEGQLSKDKLTSFMVQHDTQAKLIEKEISAAIDDNRNKLDERIKQRKLRAQSARSRSEKTFQQYQGKPQLNGIETIKEEEEESPVKRRPTGNKRSNSAEIRIRRNECP